MYCFVIMSLFVLLSMYWHHLNATGKLYYWFCPWFNLFLWILLNEYLPSEKVKLSCFYVHQSFRNNYDIPHLHWIYKNIHRKKILYHVFLYKLLQSYFISAHLHSVFYIMWDSTICAEHFIMHAIRFLNQAWWFSSVNGYLRRDGHLVPVTCFRFKFTTCLHKLPYITRKIVTHAFTTFQGKRNKKFSCIYLNIIPLRLARMCTLPEATTFDSEL